MSTPFWELTYKDENLSTFGTEPNSSIVEFEPLCQKSWRILDIGCGDGKNCLYLAGRGFPNVDAFDLSENAIARLQSIARKNNLKINAWAQDMRDFSFDAPYDLVLSFGTLHFVSKEDWRALLIKAKEYTNIGGLHIMQIFTNVLPASPDIAEFAIGLADDRELEELYSDWEILSFKSYTFEDEHPGVPKHFHASNKIVAWRVK